MLSGVETVHRHQNEAEYWKNLVRISDRWRLDRLLVRGVRSSLRSTLSTDSRTRLRIGRT